MIRPGKAVDAPVLAQLLSETCDVSRYAGAVSVDISIARKLFAQAAMKHGFSHEGGMLLMVNEDVNGEIDMFILGALSRIYVVCDMLAASDLFLIARPGSKPNPRAMTALVDAYLEWADNTPKVYEVGLSWSDATVLRGEDGRPELDVRGSVLARTKELGIQTLHVSLSHDAGIASAVVVAEGEP